ncbi:polysaccharide deacetylase family protein [Natronomonas salina]|uniref:polysaccharide deacetylase family protein n=1 Tax=Natronomonas salina TaxID=1710540 RepID=UPI0015B617C7|nr:polysaccharide deacetylase family protein [Natronomonas salina]QLD89077.1 polysaccharide deacetylase family protein [Natronomonas salina]
MADDDETPTDERGSGGRGVQRRRVLATAAGVAGLAGCLSFASTESPSTETATPTDDDEFSDPGTETETPDDDPEPFPDGGAVAFVYDDGPLSDYTKAFPAHRAFDAPATSCIVPEWIGTSRSTGEMMAVDHLEELAAAGWEIASHTSGHEPLGSFELTADAAAGDSRVYPAEIRHGHHPGKPVEITDGDRTVATTVAGSGRDESGESYVELAESLDTAFAAGDSEIRHPPELMAETLQESKQALERRGFEVSTLLAPYDQFDAYSARFASEYYEVVANGDHGSIITYPGEYEPLWTQRDYFVEYTSRETVQSALDEVAATGGLGVLGAHTFKEEVTEARIRETLEWIEDRGIEVLTMGEAARRFEASEA